MTQALQMLSMDNLRLLLKWGLFNVFIVEQHSTLAPNQKKLSTWASFSGASLSRQNESLTSGVEPKKARQ
ncbi:MAG: hypothetical protein ACXV4Z_05200 [Halobacteriota archaeon]